MYIITFGNNFKYFLKLFFNVAVTFVFTCRENINFI